MNEEPNHQTELKELELGFLNSTNHPVEELLDESLSPPENIDSGGTEISDTHSDGEGNGSDESGSGELEIGKPETGEDLVEENDNPTNAYPDLDKTLPPGIQSDPSEGVDNLYNEQNFQEDDYEFDVIVDHQFKNGVLILKARYYSESSDAKYVWESLFNTIKKDAPLELVKYIINNVVEILQRNGIYNNWAKKVLKQ
eukprot:10101988-Ditylum_brightwellii.AAC.1